MLGFREKIRIIERFSPVFAKLVIERKIQKQKEICERGKNGGNTTIEQTRSIERRRTYCKKISFLIPSKENKIIEKTESGKTKPYLRTLQLGNEYIYIIFHDYINKYIYMYYYILICIYMNIFTYI